jgi:predicted HAD superfamily Cof-like phosphohydrolase
MPDRTREDRVAEFHRAMEVSVADPLTHDLLALRLRLLNEEVAELAESVAIYLGQREKGRSDADLAAERAHMLKELADVQYVVSGFAVTFGLPLEAAFDRVHTSNMSKLVNGKPLKRDDGKVLKGPNYQPPTLDDLV